MIDIAIKNLRARKTRSLLSIVAVLVCVFLIGTVDGMLTQMKTSMAGDLARYMGKLFLQQPGAGYPPFGSIIKQEDALNAIDSYSNELNVDESTPIVFLIIEPAENPMDTASIIGVGISPGKERAYIGNIEAAEGSSTLVDLQDNMVILGSRAAERYQASVGGNITILGTSLTIAGILEPSGIKNIDKIVLMKLDIAQELWGKEGMVSTVLLTARDISKVSEIAESLSAKYPKFEVVTQKDLLKNGEKIMEMPNRFMGMISLTVFIVSIAILINVMTMAVAERTKEIGILRAIGARKGTILYMVLVETSILSAIGGILGILLVIPAAYLMDWARVLSVQETVKVSLLVVGMGLLGGLYPAYRASKISPMEALRYE